ncbi:aspartate kinase [Fructobacillus pseudoficulneus]|uniref:Aspartokinase n=1 Tax=Fructobacillus pseudoficulneus TaxID=220714 RepID=A0A3F3GR62_9LACO|nr:aspartate kinase [Fructobacillus pseudoficulneus]GAP02215.1 aspartate kinase [Fructobacillus pseudoficulneus]SEH36089.1 aspartate kinase [Fructobacillus pseudoficulneus]
MKVTKFGGSSLATGQQFDRVINILNQDSDRQVVVTSAPGRAAEFPMKVTDLLIRYGKEVIEDRDSSKTVQDLKKRYQAIADYFALPTEQFATILDQIDDLPKHQYRSYTYLRATFAAHGEYLNAQLLALILQEKGQKAVFVDPKQLHMVTDANFPTLDEDATYQELGNFEIEEGTRYIFPGFFGYNDRGEMVTFSRGGSDITGAILARGLMADVYENFTDVDAIYAVNPRLVKNPVAIHNMSYSEMRELSYAGFAVFHDEAIIPAIQGQVPINVKNTNDPDAPGTWIGPAEQNKPERRVTGIAASDSFCALYLHRYLLNKEVGFTLKILQILARHGVPYEHMPSGIDDLTIIFNKKSLNKEQIEQIQMDIEREIAPDTMAWHEDFAIVMIVGQGMKNRVGAFTEIVTPLRDAGISLQMVNQGASEISIMLGVEVDDVDNAVKAIYYNLFDDEQK